MTFTRLIWVGVLTIAVEARAVYAPIPETDLGKDLIFEVFGSASYDSNIFAAPTGAIGSSVFTLAPKISYDHSLTDQAFISGSYKLTLDHFEKRPGSKNLASHEVNGRIAYAFTPKTTIDLSDTFSIEKNPESLLPGLATPVSSDQSFDRNELDGTFSMPVGPKVNLTLKTRNTVFSYDAAKLGQDLDRTENLYGLSGDYAYQPDLKVVGEYRHQTINYDDSGNTKNKTSDFLLAGIDYEVAKKLSASGRIGGERRDRDSERSTTAPYVQTTVKYDYAERSYISAGYEMTYEEPSNVLLYTDSQVNRFFVNVQHLVSGPLSLSGSADYEPSQLKGRRGVPDLDETTVRLGAAGSYSPSKNWTFSLSYDYDNVTSDDASREYTRHRFGGTARLTF